MFLKNTFFFSFLLLAQIAFANTPVWIQLGPEGQPIARAIVAGPVCPELRIDGKVVEMDVRAPAYRDFEVTTCEAILPREAQVVRVSGQSLSMPKKEIERIVIFGDTGCVLSPTRMQGCSDLKEWPFKNLMDQAAHMAPDLVIHLGDYWYREMPCILKKTCEGSPYGNTWNAWDADFFAPAEKLLKTAPWIFVRGNHENCYRGGFGWFRFLDANPYTATCNTHAPLYKIPMGTETLFVMDSSEAQDIWAPSILVESFRKEFQAIQESRLNNVWLLTHKPLWEMDAHHGTKTLKTATEGAWPSNIQWVFSGHVHNFEVLNVSNGPTQFIVGSGGGLLQSEKSKSTSSSIHGIESRHFGFLLLSKKNGIWEGDFYDTEGMIRKHCIKTQTGVSCTHVM